MRNAKYFILNVLQKVPVSLKAAQKKQTQTPNTLTILMSRPIQKLKKVRVVYDCFRSSCITVPWICCVCVRASIIGQTLHYQHSLFNVFGSEIWTKITILMIFWCLHIWTQKHLLFSFCDCFVSKTLRNVHNLVNYWRSCSIVSYVSFLSCLFSQWFVLFTVCPFQNPKVLLWVKVEPSNLESSLFVYSSSFVL